MIITHTQENKNCSNRLAPDLPGDVAENNSLGTTANIPAAYKQTVEKLRLLQHAQKLLARHNVQNRKGTWVHRTRDCHKFIQPNHGTAIIRLSKDDIQSKAGIGQVKTCGSLWSCPVCAERVMLEKGHELRVLFERLTSDGFIPIMVTLTARHNATMTLSGFKNNFKHAWDGFINCRQWSKFKESIQVAHYIANREVTHGASGWHYHQHMVVWIPAHVVRKAFDRQDVERALNEQWLYQLGRFGLEGLENIAVKLSTHNSISETYLAKMGMTVDLDTGKLEFELTGLGNKNRSRTVWDILRHSFYGDHRSGRLYVEYVETMTGDNFLTFSRSLTDLRKELQADMEGQEPDTSDMVDWLPIHSWWWKYIWRRELISDVLEVAALTRSVHEVIDFIIEDYEYSLEVGILPQPDAETDIARRAVLRRTAITDLSGEFKPPGVQGDFFGERSGASPEKKSDCTPEKQARLF